MSFYIDPIPATTHLECIQARIKDLTELRNDLEWNGRDATSVQAQLDNLRLQHAEGVNFIPKF